MMLFFGINIRTKVPPKIIDQFPAELNLLNRLDVSQFPLKSKDKDFISYFFHFLSNVLANYLTIFFYFFQRPKAACWEMYYHVPQL